MRWRTLVIGIIAAALMACGGGASSSPARPSGPPASGSAALVGAWQTTITKADVAAAGMSDPGVQNENSGQFTWTFAADGSWTQTQVSLDGSPIKNPVFRGSYTVDGANLVASTSFPDEYRDTGLHYTFAIDGTSARFDVLDAPDNLLPIIVETHPWTRAG